MKKVGAALGKGTPHVRQAPTPHSPAAHHTAIWSTWLFFFFFFKPSRGLASGETRPRLKAPETQGSPLHPSAALVHYLPAAPPVSSLPSPPGAAPASVAWPPEVTSSWLPGVWCGCQASPLFTHWAYSLALAAPWETRGHCSVSEVAAVLPKSSGAGGGRERPPEEQNGGACWGFSVMSPQPCPVWAPSKAASPGGRSGSFSSRALPGVSWGLPPLQPRL